MTTLAGPDEPRGARRSERGSVTVVLAVVLGLGTTLASVALAAASHRVLVVRAQGAADASALAAAASVVGLGGEDPCRAARGVAEAGGAVLSDCSTIDATARVRVVVGTGPVAATAVAVAGPALGAREHSV